MLDLNSDKSIYVQIAEMIENEILSGNIQEEEQAPSTTQFSKVYQINPATAGKGLNLLVEEGILYKKRGLGMFVMKGARKKILKKRQGQFFSEILPNIVEEAKRLEISADQLVQYINSVNGGGEHVGD